MKKAGGPMIRTYILTLAFVVISVWVNSGSRDGKERTVARYLNSRIETKWSVDSNCFVQGFAKLNETHHIMSCGGYGESRLVVVSGFNQTGPVQSEVVYRSANDKKVFFEGCAVISPARLIVLTWREHVILEFDLPSFELRRKVFYPKEGWGLTYDPQRNLLWATDGTNQMYRIDPHSLEIRSSCRVGISYHGQPPVGVNYLNELEYINGRIYANIFIDNSGIAEKPNYIVIIHPETCAVTEVIPIFGLHDGDGINHVFNGIAEGSDGVVLVTGKKWSHVYSLTLLGEAERAHPDWSQWNISAFTTQHLHFR